MHRIKMFCRAYRAFLAEKEGGGHGTESKGEDEAGNHGFNKCEAGYETASQRNRLRADEAKHVMQVGMYGLSHWGTRFTTIVSITYAS
jgi:hypothetical protein